VHRGHAQSTAGSDSFTCSLCVTEIVRLIGASRERAMQTVNTALIDLYWQIGEIISRRVAAAQWGEGAVDQLASYIARWEPGIREFSRSNLLRMRQFYETYPKRSICRTTGATNSLVTPPPDSGPMQIA
jgi:hypothetical protein